MEVAPVHLLLFAFIINLCDLELHFVPVVLNRTAKFGEVQLKAVHMTMAGKINIVNITEIVDAFNQCTIVQRSCRLS